MLAAHFAVLHRRATELQCISPGMVDRNLIREFNVNEADLQNALGDSLNDWHHDDAHMDVLYDERARSFDVNKTVSGTII